MLTEQKNVVATVAAGTGVRLPGAAGAGLSVVVWNDGANTLTVYAPSGGNINGSASVTLAPGTAGRWITTSAIAYRTEP